MPDVAVILARLLDRVPVDAIDQGVVVRWDVVAGSSPISFQTALDNGQWVVSEGVPSAPWLAVAVSVDDLLRLAAGRLGGAQAFLSGRLRLSGDLVLAQRLLPGFEGGPDAVIAARPDQPTP